MPVLKCPDGKYRIGHGKCIYDSKEKAERAYRGYLASKWSKAKGLAKRFADFVLGRNNGSR